MFNREDLYKNYVEIAALILTNISENSPYYMSYKSLENAVSEITKDVEIIKNRRNFKTLSVGKIAGIIAFRFSKWKIIQCSDQAVLENNRFIKIDYILAVSLAFKYIGVETSSIKTNLLSEIIYTLSRRHMNQETLGIVFDAILSMRS